MRVAPIWRTGKDAGAENRKKLNERMKVICRHTDHIRQIPSKSLVNNLRTKFLIIAYFAHTILRTKRLVSLRLSRPRRRSNEALRHSGDTSRNTRLAGQNPWSKFSARSKPCPLDCRSGADHFGRLRA